ncbi:inositol monophosphatase family protein [Buchnera aphidicola]|uniref:inositol monophosphatase family protein n=1 Tax=Buchnera aphidicola TaxID=9 RepID=UPI0030EEA02D
MNPMLNIAIKAVRIGGDNMAQLYDRNIKNINKKEIFLKIIEQSYQIMFNIIKRYYPLHIIYNYNNYINYKNIFFKKKINFPIWILKTISGEENFKKQIPYFCVSISILIKKKNSLSIIYDPLRNELFTAIKGKGAQSNGYRIKKENKIHLKNCICSLKNKNIDKNNSYKYFKIIKMLNEKKIKIRNLGSTSLDLAYLSDGRIDYILDFNFKPHKFIVGKLNVIESGGIISDFKGGCNYINSLAIISRNIKLLKFFLKK